MSQTFFKFQSQLSNTFQLHYSMIPSDATYQNVQWSQEDPTIAQVDTNGMVTAISEGTCNIKVTSLDGNFTDYCEVIVNKYIPEITVTPSELIMIQNDYETLVLNTELDASNASWSLDENTLNVLENDIASIVLSSDKKTATITSKITSTAINSIMVYVTFNNSIIKVPVEIHKVDFSLIYTTDEPLAPDLNIKNRSSFNGATYASGNSTSTHSYTIDCDILNKLNIPYTVQYTVDPDWDLYLPIFQDNQASVSVPNYGNDVIVDFLNRTANVKFKSINKELTIYAKITYANKKGLYTLVNKEIVQKIVNSDRSKWLTQFSVIDAVQTVSSSNIVFNFMPYISQTPNLLNTDILIIPEDSKFLNTNYTSNQGKTWIPGATRPGMYKFTFMALVYGENGNIDNNIYTSTLVLVTPASDPNLEVPNRPF